MAREHIAPFPLPTLSLSSSLRSVTLLPALLPDLTVSSTPFPSNLGTQVAPCLATLVHSVRSTIMTRFIPSSILNTVSAVTRHPPALLQGVVSYPHLSTLYELARLGCSPSTFFHSGRMSGPRWSWYSSCEPPPQVNPLHRPIAPPIPSAERRRYLGRQPRGSITWTPMDPTTPVVGKAPSDTSTVYAASGRSPFPSHL